MTRKEKWLVAFTVMLVGVYVCFFLKPFQRLPIRIEHTDRPSLMLTRRQGNAAAPAEVATHSLTFSLGHEYDLTSVKVVPTGEYLTNKNVHPLWHLTANPKSAPTKGFIYGGTIEGMEPFVAGAPPAVLEPNVQYRIIVEAGRLQGEHDFKLAGGAPAGR